VPTLNERATVTRLLGSVLAQEYRPIEAVVVDGGSDDGTLEALSGFRDQSYSKGFELGILHESDYSSFRSPANARNIGLRNCKGKYVLFFDADFVLEDPHFIAGVCNSLKSHPWVGVKVKPVVDTWLEFHCAVDDFRRDVGSNVHVYCAFERDLLLNVMYDPRLGLMEDWDLGKRLESEYDLHPSLAEVWCSRHFAERIDEWKSQALWHGQTLAQFVKKWRLVGLSVLVRRTGAGASVVLSISSLAFSTYLAVLFALLFFCRVLVAYLASAEKSRFRLGYLLLRESYWSLTFLVGFALGVLQQVRQLRGRKSSCNEKGIATC